MQAKLSKGWSLLLSGGLAVFVHWLLLGPVFEQPRLGLPADWLVPVKLLAAFGSTLALHFIFQSKFGERLFSRGRTIGRLLARLVGKKPPLYLTDREYRMDVTNSIRSSPFMYCLLTSGYTMQSGREEFIPRCLSDLGLAKLEKKDMRILLLNPHCEFWKKRALAFAEKPSQPRVEIRDYRVISEKTAKMFQEKFRAKIGFYRQCPSWRLYIFKDRVYVSHYYEPPHKETMAGYRRSDPPYDWFYSAFRDISPWRDEDTAREAAEKAVMEHEVIAPHAQNIYKERVLGGKHGTAEGDWTRAERELREEMRDQLLEKLLPSRLPENWPP